MATAARQDIQGFKVLEGTDFQARLAALLSLASLDTVAFKAKELQGESEKIYCGGRIITDIRPVFGDNFDDDPAMIIVHTLKIGFHQTPSGHKDIFIALDGDDIAALKKTLQRAEEKARKLKRYLSPPTCRKRTPT